MPRIELQIPTPRWALPLLEPRRYKGVKGGRGGGKSWFFADYLIEQHVCNPHLQTVCIREVQYTLDTSVKKLLEERITILNVGHLFDIQVGRILDKRGRGLLIFRGMQDYNATNIKSLEGFDRAWVEEAQSLSQRSLQLLRPTIRKDNSEIYFSWNPEHETDPVDRFFAEPRPNAIVVTCNLMDNPFRSKLMEAEMEADRRTLDPLEFHHIWEGGYRIISREQIFADKVRVAEFTPSKDWDGPYYGADWGFGVDPTVAVELWIHGDRLYWHRESYRYHLELDDTPRTWQAELPGIERHTVRADSARPDSISYVRRHGIPRIVPAEKGSGSIEDGIQFLRSFEEIVIHPRCKGAIAEARNYKWKTNRAGDILPEPVDRDNHGWDSVRYALEPLIKGRLCGMATPGTVTRSARTIQY
jgi:phage terminase large subunit